MPVDREERTPCNVALPNVFFQAEKGARWFVFKIPKDFDWRNKLKGGRLCLDLPTSATLQLNSNMGSHRLCIDAEREPLHFLPLAPTEQNCPDLKVHARVEAVVTVCPEDKEAGAEEDDVVARQDVLTLKPLEPHEHEMMPMAFWCIGPIYKKDDVSELRFKSYERLLRRSPRLADGKQTRREIIGKFPDAPKMELSGSLDRHDEPQYLLGVQLKKQLQLIEADVFPVDRTREAPDETQGVKMMSAELWAKRKSAAQTFGTSKKAKFLESYEQRKVDDEKVVDLQDGLDELWNRNEAKLNEENMTDQELEVRKSLLPPFDEAATEAENIYGKKGLDAIAREEMMSRETRLLEDADDLIQLMQDKSDKILALPRSRLKEICKTETACEIVLCRAMAKLPKLDKPEAENLARRFVVLNCLILIHKDAVQAAEKGKGKGKCCGPLASASELVKYWGNEFKTTIAGHSNILQQNKIACYAIVWALHLAPSLQLDAICLKEDLNMDKEKLRKMLEMIGCHVTTQKKNEVGTKAAAKSDGLNAILKAPMKVVIANKPKSKAKRR